MIGVQECGTYQALATIGRLREEAPDLKAFRLSISIVAFGRKGSGLLLVPPTGVPQQSTASSVSGFEIKLGSAGRQLIVPEAITLADQQYCWPGAVKVPLPLSILSLACPQHLPNTSHTGKISLSPPPTPESCGP